MFTFKSRILRISGTLSLVLALVLSTAWANHYYSGSVEVRLSNSSSAKFFLVNDGANKIQITIPNNSLDDYMTEQGINKVEITADLNSEWVSTGDGSGYYQLHFTFGPSGAYFTPDELEVELTGRYVSDNTNVMMYDEEGEVLQFSRNGNSNKITVYIPHFSCYYYEDYSY